MNKGIAATCLVAGMALITGCGGSSSHTAASTSASASASSTANHTRNESAYLTVLHGELGDHGTESDKTLITLGHSVCDSYDNGASFSDVITTMHQSLGHLYTAEQLGNISGASIAAFCPDHSDMPSA